MLDIIQTRLSLQTNFKRFSIFHGAMYLITVEDGSFMVACLAAPWYHIEARAFLLCSVLNILLPCNLLLYLCLDSLSETFESSRNAVVDQSSEVIHSSSYLKG